MPLRDPDEALTVIFRNHAVLNQAKTVKAGRKIYDDVELCEVRFPGSKASSGFPATAQSHWAVDPETGGQVIVTYAERFRRQYRQFKEQQTQTKSGTPLEHVPFLTAARQAELRALNIYTVEQLAHLDGQELKNLGPGGRGLKNQAEEFIADSLKGAPNLAVAAELEALKARNQMLEDDNIAMQHRLKSGEGEFEAMSLDALKEYIRVNAGTAPVGQPNRRTLIRMAMDCRPAEKAA